LYYDYGRSDEKEFSRNTIDDYSFYYDSSNYGDFSLDDLSFVASDRFNTTVTLSFRAYGSGSSYVDGTVTISTTDSAKRDGDIAYTVSPGEEVSFNAVDFNDFFQKNYSGDIRYVRFDTASSLTSDNGRLYFDYEGFDEKEFSKNTVDDYDFYYRDKAYGEFDLDKLSFVASRDFNTTVSLTFRAYAASGKYVDGTVTIKPPAGAATKGANIVYATTYNTNVQINANDIARFLSKTYPGQSLQYVELGGVPESGGLYYNYYSASKYGASSQLKLTGSNCDDQKLYFSPTSNSQYALTELTYVPNGVNYCVRIPFTAYGGGSRSVSGTILISVNVSEVAEVYGAVPRGSSVALPASAIYNAVAAASSNALASIQFLSLPDSSAGALYAGSGTSSKANLTTKYGYSAGTDRMAQLRFVPASNFIGSVELPYVAYNASGNAIASGRFCLGVVNSVAKYSDMPASSWCYKYITELSDAKIIGGYKNNTYRPNAAVTYGEALKLILLASGYSVQPRTDTHWASGYLTRAKADNLLSGSVKLDAPITRLAVAQIAAKAMKLSTSGLSSVEPFTDTTDNFVQALSAAGIVDGFFSNGVSTFKPGSTLTRGQISAIVWRMERARR
ncbi:MAG: S-layer homology domain-containing protein, partial [Oscillibacter sp.]